MLFGAVVILGICLGTKFFRLFGAEGLARNTERIDHRLSCKACDSALVLIGDRTGAWERRLAHDVTSDIIISTEKGINVLLNGDPKWIPIGSLI